MSFDAESAKEDVLTEWQFGFGLCGNEMGQKIPRSKCDELLDLIIDWAEANDFGIGGGYGPFKADEPENDCTGKGASNNGQP